MQVLDSRGRPVPLGAELGRGGEGTVFALSDSSVVAKVYHQPVVGERAAKIGAMVALRTDRLSRLAAWPVETLHERATGAIVGILIPRATGYKAIHNLYGPKARRVEFPRAGWPFCIHAATNVARAFAVVHEHGHVIGDVNHGNVVISGQAMAMLIDCDSFQVASGARRYLCDVGVSTHQPPELQIIPTFRGVVRTPNHDNFGLAVLVFQLLMMGRHPFAGTYLATGDMPIERAIQEHRFAYGAAAQSRLIKPPPNTPPLNALSPTVARLFECAFAPEGVRERGRPDARQWVVALKRLREQVTRCDQNQSHSHLETLSACPWCALESRTGIRLFAPTVTDPKPDPNAFGLASIWSEIASVAGPGPAPRLPDWSRLDFRPSERARRSGQVRKVGQGVATVAALVGLALVAAGIPSAGLGATPSVVGAAVVGGTIYRGSSQARLTAGRTLHVASDRYESLATRWKSEAGDGAFLKKLRELERARQDYLILPTRRQEQLRRMATDLRHRQVTGFLDRYPLSAANLSGIGPGREMTLRSYGIETAADVTADAIGAIPGFGAALTGSLLDWRRSIEWRFVFDPAKGVDPRDLDDLENDLKATKHRLEHTLRGGAAELRKITQQALARRQTLRVEIDRAQAELARADAEWRVS